MPRAPSESVLAPSEVVLELLELLEAVPLAPSEVVQAPSEVVLEVWEALVRLVEWLLGAGSAQYACRHW